MEKEMESLKVQVKRETETASLAWRRSLLQKKIAEGTARGRPSVTLEDLRNATTGRGKNGDQGGSIARESDGEDHAPHAAPSGNVVAVGRRLVARAAAKTAALTDADQSGGGVDRDALDGGAEHKLRLGHPGGVLRGTAYGFQGD